MAPGVNQIVEIVIRACSVKTESPNVRLKFLFLRNFGRKSRAATASGATTPPGSHFVSRNCFSHSNRLVTPFPHPRVMFSDVAGAGGDECSLVCVRENVIYVAPERVQPLTMFITEKDAQARAMSLTLIPRRIPLREMSQSTQDSAGANLVNRMDARITLWARIGWPIQFFRVVQSVRSS